MDIEKACGSCLKQNENNYVSKYSSMCHYGKYEG